MTEKGGVVWGCVFSQGPEKEAVTEDVGGWKEKSRELLSEPTKGGV